MTERGRPATLSSYYSGLGLPEEAWHVGPEHPSLEQLAIRLLATMTRNRILEIGVQSGGFAVPVVLAVYDRPDFSYTGVDSREYTNAVPLHLISDYLALHGVTRGIHLIEGDSTSVLRSFPSSAFDLILLDHYKPKYSYDLLQIFHGNLLSDNGAIVLHDVLTHASREWQACERLCTRFGYSSRLDPAVYQGAGIIQRRVGRSRQDGRQLLATLAVSTRWRVHTAVLRSRRMLGRLLRATGLR